MRILLDSNWETPHTMMGRYRWMRNVIRNIQESGHRYDCSPKGRTEYDLTLVENPLSAGRVAYYLHNSHRNIDRIRVFTHSLHAHYVWDMIRFWSRLRFCVPSKPVAKCFYTFAEDSPVSVHPWPVYPLDSDDLPGDSYETVFFGRVDADTKFDLLRVLKKVPQELLKNCAVVGAPGNAAYTQAVIKFCNRVGMGVHIGAKENIVGRILNSTDRIMCLSNSIQESYGFAPREALYTKARVITTGFSGYSLDEFGPRESNVFKIPIYSNYVKRDLWDEKSSVSEIQGDMDWNRFTEDVINTLQFRPTATSKEAMSHRLGVLRQINTQFIPSLLQGPKSPNFRYRPQPYNPQKMFQIFCF